MTQFEIFKVVGNRFINDWKIPVSIGASKDCSEEFFGAFIEMLETIGQKDRWDQLIASIIQDYGNDPVTFLDDFYACREKLMETVKANPKFQAFNTSKDMREYKLEPVVKPVRKELYGGDAGNKFYISVDLRSANFTALHFVDPEILGNAGSYKEFVKTVIPNEFMAEYFSESKYCRQVVFGQLNPSRQISVEKFIITNLLNNLYNVIEKFPGFITLEVLNSDEVIFSFSEKLPEDRLADIRAAIISMCQMPEFSRLTPDCFKVEYFTVVPFSVYNFENGSKCFSFFQRLNLETGENKLKCIDKRYYYLTDALFYGKEVKPWMKYAYMDNMVFALKSSIIIKRDL